MSCESWRKPACASRNILPGLNPRRLFPHPFVFSSLFGPQTTTNSNHSHTSAAFPCKSNHSRTYAKHRGWGSYLHSNVSKICRRADILECGGSPPLLGVTKGRQLNCMRGTDGIAKAGASSRTPRPAFAGTTGGQKQIPRAARDDKSRVTSHGSRLPATAGRQEDAPCTSRRNPRAARLRRTGPTRVRNPRTGLKTGHYKPKRKALATRRRGR